MIYFLKGKLILAINIYGFRNRDICIFKEEWTQNFQSYSENKIQQNYIVFILSY